MKVVFPGLLNLGCLVIFVYLTTLQNSKLYDHAVTKEGTFF